LKAQLRKLVRMQELVLEIRRADRIVGQAPTRLEEIETRFRERNAEYVAVQDRHDELDADRRARSSELEVLEESRKKFMDDLMQAKNQREYAALLKEIDAVKAQISENEDVILRDMEEIEKVTEELKTHAEHIQVERETVARESAEVESENTAARKVIEANRAERTQLEQDLPEEIVGKVVQLERARQGIFLAKVEAGTCEACYVRIRPQVCQEIKVVSKIHRCSSCARFLYHEPSLIEKKPAPVADAGGSVEAVNGGPV